MHLRTLLLSELNGEKAAFCIRLVRSSDQRPGVRKEN